MERLAPAIEKALTFKPSVIAKPIGEVPSYPVLAQQQVVTSSEDSTSIEQEEVTGEAAREMAAAIVGNSTE